MSRVSELVCSWKVAVVTASLIAFLFWWSRRAQEELAKKIAAEEAAEAEAKAAREAKEAAEVAEKAEAEAAARALAEQAKETPSLPSPASEPVASSAADAEEGSVHGSSIDVQVNLRLCGRSRAAFSIAV